MPFPTTCARAGALQDAPLKLVQHASCAAPYSRQRDLVGLTRPRTCRNSERLTSFFNLLSITPDPNGEEYISIVEAERYPFIAVQFHPEQPCFEWHNPKVPHSTNAVRLSQALSLAFVEVRSLLLLRCGAVLSGRARTLPRAPQFHCLDALCVEVARVVSRVWCLARRACCDLIWIDLCSCRRRDKAATSFPRSRSS